MEELIKEARQMTAKEMLRFQLQERKDLNLNQDFRRFVRLNKPLQRTIFLFLEATIILSFIIFVVVWVWIDWTVALKGALSTAVLQWVVLSIKSTYKEKDLNEYLSRVANIKAVMDLYESDLSDDEKALHRAYELVYIHSKIALMSPEQREQLTS